MTNSEIHDSLAACTTENQVLNVVNNQVIPTGNGHLFLPSIRAAFDNVASIEQEGNREAA